MVSLLLTRPPCGRSHSRSARCWPLSTERSLDVNLTFTCTLSAISHTPILNPKAVYLRTDGEGTKTILASMCFPLSEVPPRMGLTFVSQCYLSSRRRGLSGSKRNSGSSVTGEGVGRLLSAAIRSRNLSEFRGGCASSLPHPALRSICAGSAASARAMPLHEVVNSGMADLHTHIDPPATAPSRDTSTSAAASPGPTRGKGPDDDVLRGRGVPPGSAESDRS